MRLSLPEPIIAGLPVVTRLLEHQFDAVFVGGAVRDTVIGLPIKDVDIATSARPEQVLELFERCIPTGLQHGTITVVYQGENYEVTTFRQESAYEAYRKPESVLYITELEGDLLRRDFTINAMALSADGELIDPYNGLLDIERRTIRCVGNADARFQEDALRMLRAVRLIGVYSFVPAHQTWRALLRHRALMKHIAMERVQAELDKMLAGNAPQRALHFAAASGLLLHLKEQLPLEVEKRLRRSYRSTNSPLLFEKLHLLCAVDLRWAAVWIDSLVPLEEVRQIHRLLRFSKNRSKQIEAILAIHDVMIAAAQQADERHIRLDWVKAVIRYGKSSAKEWLTVAEAFTGEHLSSQDRVLKRCGEWLEEISVCKLKQLQVTGSDLATHLKMNAGPWVSELLNRLLLGTASGELENVKLNLLQQAELWSIEEPDHE